MTLLGFGPVANRPERGDRVHGDAIRPIARDNDRHLQLMGQPVGTDRNGVVLYGGLSIDTTELIADQPLMELYG